MANFERCPLHHERKLKIESRMPVAAQPKHPYTRCFTVKLGQHESAAGSGTGRAASRFCAELLVELLTCPRIIEIA